MLGENGKRDRLITLKQYTLSEIVVGAPEKTEATYGTKKAEKIPMSGKEAVQLNRETATEIAGWRVLYDANVTPEMWIEVEGKTWDILYIRELGRRQEMVITAEARS